MAKVNSGYHMNGDIELWYEVIENGFEIYFGENTSYPSISQPEPYIPYPNLSYEENAKKMCENLQSDAPVVKKTMEERLTTVEANLDYLMLISDSTDE